MFDRATAEATATETPSTSAGSTPLRLLLAVMSGVLLFLPCVEPRLFVTAWGGFVPLLFALRGTSPRQAYLLGAVAGTVFWIGACYWMAEFVSNLKEYQAPYNYIAAASFWLWAGQSFGIVSMLLRWLSARVAISVVFLFPILFVSVFSLYPMLFDMRMGEGQTGFPVALQAADTTGAHGIDFVMAMTSAVIFLACAGWRARVDRVAIPVAVAVIATWFAYGFQALYHWDRTIAEWPTKRVGIVQPNDRVTLQIPRPAPGYSRTAPPEMEMTERLGRAGAELVIWPEARFKGYFYYDIVREAYSERLAALGSTAVLFHDLDRERGGDKTVSYNSAALIGPDGEQIASYRKMRRMAFGEYAPIVSEIPFLRSLIEHYFGDFLREIAPGKEHKVIQAAGMRVVPKICYESAFPADVADAIVDNPNGTVLAVMSLDGWFGETRQPFQHLWASSVRAVENRIPMIHVINNGPSAVILPSGRFAFRTTPYVRSETVVDMPYSATSGGTFFTRNPRLFVYSVYSAFAGLLVAGLFLPGWRPWRTGGSVSPEHRPTP